MVNKRGIARDVLTWLLAFTLFPAIAVASGYSGGGVPTPVSIANGGTGNTTGTAAALVSTGGNTIIAVTDNLLLKMQGINGGSANQTEWHRGFDGATVGYVNNGGDTLNIPNVITSSNLICTGGNVSALQTNLSVAPTVVNGSAGTLSWVQTDIGSGFKRVVIHLAGYSASGTTVITPGTAFSFAPVVVTGTQGVSTLAATTTTTATTITVPIAATDTGFIIVEGY
jgi:hypothetical protein